MNILECMNDKTLFAPIFKRRWLGLGADSWVAWRSLLASLFGLPLEGEALELYRKHTGRQDPPAKQFSEGFCIIGRRGGKSIQSAFIATFLSVFRDYSAYLAPGERPICMLLAQDKAQAAILLRYIGGFFDSIPLLRKMVKARLRESIELSNGISLQVHTSSYKSVRGYSCVCCIADELAFWQDDSGSNPASEVLAAVRPSLATIPGSLLLGISSPYSQRGLLFEQFKAHYGKNDSPTLIWRGTSEEMNPTLDKRVVAAAFASDPASASAEYGAAFRTDVENFLPLAVVESCISTGCFERPVEAGKNYVAFVDSSGGVSDSAVLAIAHEEHQKAILDMVRERQAPFQPQSVTQEFGAILKRYGLSTVTGDRYSAQWVVQEFARCGVEYKASERSKSQIYLEALPLFSAQRCELLDLPRLKNQLVNLERRTARGGQDSIDHGVGQHDDIANAVCGALVLAAGEGDIFGLIQLLEGIRDGRYDPEARMTLPTITTRPAQVPLLPPTVCPRCASAQFVIRTGAALHCNRCQHTFFKDGQAPEIMVAGFRGGRPQVYLRRLQ